MNHCAVVTLAAALTAFAGPSNAQTAHRYALDVSVVREGLTVSSARTLMTETGSADIVISAGDTALQVNAALTTLAGADDRLQLTVDIVTDDAEAQHPVLTVRRGGTARMVMGESRDDTLVNGATVTLSPAD